MGLPDVAATAVSPMSSDVRTFLKRGGLFLLVGLAIYAGVYAAAEALVYRYGHRNRFYAVRATPPSRFDYVILGASHAAVFDYRDMNAHLERLTGARIRNLAVVGGGVSVNALLLDYFLTRHSAGAVVYVVDSFGFYSPEWNERRLQDRRLFARAPFDPALVPLLLTHRAGASVAFDYASGFSKINNRERFAADVFPDEVARFDRRYRPVAQLDHERLAYLYPSQVDADVFMKYLAEFDALVGAVQARGMAFIAIRPPIPVRVLRMIPGEAQFDAALRTVLARRGVELHDFSHVGNDDALFQDTDHLNRAGVLEFFNTSLAPMLRRP